jgi:hypothetical protein
MEVGHALEQIRVAGGERNRLLPPFSVFPADLRTWLPDSELNQIIAEAVHRADHTGVRAEFISRWDSLLARTAGAYAAGIYSSDQIAETAGECPLDGGAAIRHFRRCNKTVLERTLVSILRISADKQRLIATPWSVSLESTICEAEAKTRIARAIEVDSWSIDED